MADINALYKVEKGTSADPNAPVKDKWEACLQSKEEKMTQNTLYCAQQLLQKNEGFDIFKQLLYSLDDKVTQNTMHLLCNFATNKSIVEEVKNRGFSRLLTVLTNTPLPKQLYLLHFIANILQAGAVDASFTDKFINDGGLVAAMNILSNATNAQLSNLALVVFSNIVAARQKTRDYAIFATPANFEAFASILKNSSTQNPNAVKMVLTIVANLVNFEVNRDLFHESKAVPSTLDLLRNHVELQEIIVTLLANMLHKVEAAHDIVDNKGVTPIVNCLDSTNVRVVGASLSALNNLATVGDEVMEKALPALQESKTFNKILGHARAPANAEIKLKCIKSLSNFMACEPAQASFKEAGGIETLLEVAKTEKNEEVKLKALNALFHLTMYNDEMRLSVLKAGLDDLAGLLFSPNQSAATKKAVAKSMVNMALTGDEKNFSEKKAIPGLIHMLSKAEGDDEVEELSCMALENLAINQKLNQVIAQHGGVEASVDFLLRAKSNNNPKTKERSAKLISRLAVNSKTRKKLQDCNVPDILNGMEKDGDSALRSAIQLATGSLAVPHFELAEKPAEAPSFPEFDTYQLDSEGEDEDEEEEVEDKTITTKIETTEDIKKESQTLKKETTKETPVVTQKTHTPTEEKAPKRKKGKTMNKPPPPPDSDPERLRLAKMHFKRTKVAYELLSTEGTYCNNLSIIITKFQNPLLQISRSKKPILLMNQIKTIFGSVEILFGYNSMLLDSLNQRMSQWGSHQVIGDIFFFMGDCFKVYTDYINNFDQSQQMLQNCVSTNPKFKKWLEGACKMECCKGLSLLSFLIMPVQRMPRYSLLLRELKRTTPEDHPDNERLDKAIEKIDYVNNYLNNKKREAETQFKMIELAERLSGNMALLIQPMRRFEAEAEVTWSDPKNHKVKGFLFVFNDSIIYTKSEKIMQFVELGSVVVSQEESKGDKLLLSYQEMDKKKAVLKHTLEFVFTRPAEATMLKMLIMDLKKKCENNPSLFLQTNKYIN